MSTPVLLAAYAATLALDWLNGLLYVLVINPVKGVIKLVRLGMECPAVEFNCWCACGDSPVYRERLLAHLADWRRRWVG